jgi:hypothetical protein
VGTQGWDQRTLAAGFQHHQYACTCDTNVSGEFEAKRAPDKSRLTELEDKRIYRVKKAMTDQFVPCRKQGNSLEVVVPLPAVVGGEAACHSVGLRVDVSDDCST